METTKEDFELFKQECLKWVNYFGLKDWKIDFLHEEVKGAYAECRFNGIESKYAIIVLTTELDDKTDVPLFNIKRTAFHEIWEVILWPLNYIGTCRYVQPEEFTTAVHTIIRTMENTIYQDLTHSPA